MTLETDKYSEEYLAMEDERKELKKQIIELDYEHKMVFAGKMREVMRPIEEPPVESQTPQESEIREA